MAKARMAEFESTGDEKPPRSEKVVVYDPGTGRIVYVHEFIGSGAALHGPGTRKERERVALEALERHDLKRGYGVAKGLRIMHLPRNFRFEAEMLYRVNPRANKLSARRPQRNKTKSAR
jgi:hypothetical protein